MPVTTQLTSHQDLGSRAFVTGMMHPDGTIVADDLYRVGDRLGFSTHQIRLVLARLVDEGTFTQEGRGRKAVLRTTDRHAALVEPELEWLRLAYLQDAGEAPWDGRWTLVTFGLDEERRSARNTLRELLHTMAAAPLAAGVYVHANDITDEVLATATGLGVTDGLTTARTDSLTIGGRTRPREIAAHLWPLDELAEGYRDFVATYAPHLRRRIAADPVDELAKGFEIVAAFRACSDADPLLPPELLSGRWPGAAARDVLRRFSSRLASARAAADVPVLFSRYDRLFDDLHGERSVTPR
jgi:phenylacetic acid degradation operon negative regulatory protein